MLSRCAKMQQCLIFAVLCAAFNVGCVLRKAESFCPFPSLLRTVPMPISMTMPMVQRNNHINRGADDNNDNNLRSKKVNVLRFGITRASKVKVKSSSSLWMAPRSYNNNDDNENDNENENDDETSYGSDESFELPPPPTKFNDDDDDLPCTRQEMEGFTVAQLRQQLRLRGKKVGGKKSELIDRILGLDTNNNAAAIDANTNTNTNTNTDIDIDTMGDNAATATATTTSSVDDRNTGSSSSTNKDSNGKISKARAFAESKGKELIDVTEYLDQKDKGKDFKETPIGPNANANANPDANIDISDEQQLEQELDSEESSSSSSPETWGDEARIVEDYEGRSMIVDSLSRTVVQFEGANKEPVQAYVVATRNALTGYLKGGDRDKDQNESKNNNKNNATNTDTDNDSATITSNIQKSKERAAKVPMRLGDDQGKDIDDDEGYYKNILDRDYGDWGDISTTGVQISSQEVQGILLLSDVYGPFTEHTKALADKIAFECQPIVVFVPDVFRGKPWKQDHTKTARVDMEGRTYDQWRESHSDQRVSVDIRAAAAALRKQYAVTSVSLFGTCYGGGRALEATARVYPHNNMDCESGMVGPPHVDPMACVVWYPTMYDPKKLFGLNHDSIDGNNNDNHDSSSDDDKPITKTAIMAVFAGEDTIPGATSADAATLKTCLADDDRVKDYMVKVFSGERHGFAHDAADKVKEPEVVDKFLDEEFGGVPTNSMDGGNAEVAYLLSTAWIETYSRVFLPTIGPKAADDAAWSQLDMQDLSYSNERDVRQEMEEALDNREDIEPDFRRMHPDDFKTPMDDMESMEDESDSTETRENTKPYGISMDEDVDTILEKIKDAIDRDDLSWLPGAGEIPLDESGEAYW